MSNPLTAQLTGAEGIVWDLSDLYAGMDDPQLNADLDVCDAEADALGEAYRGRIAGLDAAELAALIARYEALAERAGRSARSPRSTGRRTRRTRHAAR